MDMTPAYIKKLCKENDLYGTPHLNDRLYLHYKGFKCISGLTNVILITNTDGHFNTPINTYTSAQYSHQ